MKWILTTVIAAAGMFFICCETEARPLLHDPVELNIGVNCQWQGRCMTAQRKAMKRSLAYVSATRPPQWRVQLCNRNAARGRYRVDWVGYEHCIRNLALRRSRPSRRYAAR